MHWNLLLARIEFHLATDVLWTILSQEASAAIAGDGVFRKLKFESGIHRVQVLVTTSQIYMSTTKSTFGNH